MKRKSNEYTVNSERIDGTTVTNDGTTVTNKYNDLTQWIKCTVNLEQIDRTTVTNVKVSHLRPKYNDLKQWMNNKNNIYIGRAGVVFINGERFPKKQSMWANPFKVGRDGSLPDVLAKFENYIIEKIEKERLLSELNKLRNKNLGCWCVSKSMCYNANLNDQKVCHGQIILDLLHKYK
jgi:hypothetical protein